MKDKIEKILMKKYPNASKEWLSQMVEIYLWTSLENAKTLGK